LKGKISDLRQNASLMLHLTLKVLLMNTVKILLRTDQENKDGTHTVTARTFINKHKRDLSLRIYVKIKDWSFARGLVKKSDKNHVRKNRLIIKFKNKIENIIDDAFLNDVCLTFDDFKSQLFNKEYNDSSFYDFVTDGLQQKKLANETSRTYKSQITKLKKYRKQLAFSEINKSFILSYKNYMLSVLGNNLNTTNKSLASLKTFINWAIEEHLIKENPFNNIKISKVKGKRQYLTVSELERLEKLYAEFKLNARQLNVLRYFLFVCYTGLRYTDLKNLRYRQIRKRLIDGNEILFIDLKMHKTQLDVSIPIIKKARKLMPQKFSQNQKVFRVLSNQKTNQYLKELIKTADIDKNITFHCARHTLATTGLEMGIPIEVVSKILGHTEIKMTQIYAKVNDSLKYKEMLKLDN
jgi:site-specific recombinase XerD